MLNETTGKHHVMLQNAVLDFKEAMRIRSGLTLRIATRVTSVLRIGMISLAVVAVVFLLLLAMVSSKLGYMIDVMNTMNAQFSSMAKDMSAMREVIGTMDKNVASLPVIVGEVNGMHNTVAMMNRDIQQIAKRMHDIEANLNGITQSVGQMTQTFGVMDNHVQDIDANVHRMSRPMKLFNNLMPPP